jgi:hypothetical protein
VRFEVFMAVAIKVTDTYSVMLCSAVDITDVSEQPSTSIFNL